MMLWIVYTTPYGRKTRPVQSWENALEWADYFGMEVVRVRATTVDTTIWLR